MTELTRKRNNSLLLGIAILLIFSLFMSGCIGINTSGNNAQYFTNEINEQYKVLRVDTPPSGDNYNVVYIKNDSSIHTAIVSPTYDTIYYSNETKLILVSDYGSFQRWKLYWDGLK